MKNIHRINGNIYITNDEEIKEDDWVIEITTSPRAPYIGKTFYPKNDGTVTEEDLKKYLLSVNYKDHYETTAHKGTCSKIILTTDTDLIKDGVQAIDDEFLEWICKNPSCEYVETVNVPYFDESGYSYLLIVPKEEPKQRFEKYSERFNNKENELVQGVFNPDNWGNRLVNVEPKQETLEEVAEEFYSEQSKAYEDETEAVFDTSRYLVDGFIAGAKWQQQQNKNLYSEEDLEQAHFDGKLKKQSFKEWFEQFKKK